MTKGNTASRRRRYTMALAVAWTAVICLSLIWTVLNNRQRALESAKFHVRFAHEKDLLNRQWNSMHGGVYVPVTNDTPPNPLIDLPERDIVTPSGRQLTLINPDHMMRQLHDISSEGDGVRGRTTSLNPLRADNAPDAWEAEALLLFEQGVEEVTVVGDIDGVSHMRMMRPLVAEQSCLTCHAQEGHRVGDIQGGVSVSVPMSPLWATFWDETQSTALGHGTLLILGLGVLWMATRRIKSRESDREVAEREVRIAHAELEMLLRSIPSILIGVDSQDRITAWNPAAARIFGIPRDEVFGKPFVESGIRWDWPSILQQIAECVYGDGSSRMDDITFTRPDDKEGILGVTINPITDQGDESNGYLLLGADITVRKVLEAQLSQAQKLESIGQLAAGIAHEINTPTQYVGDNTRFLQEAFADLATLLAKFDVLLAAVERGEISPEDAAQLKEAAETADLEYLAEEIPRAIDQSLEGVGRVAKIVGAMKEFSHPGANDFTTIDINRAIESTATVARNEWKYVADLDLDLDQSLPLVSCLPGEFNQVILNIIINASHAIAGVVGDGANGKGNIRVSTRHDGDWAEIRIADSGTGIPEECQSKIFEQFFTTKEVGKGTGQGLAIAHSVITKKHSGSITFESEMGKGTEFIIRLPVETDEPRGDEES